MNSFRWTVTSSLFFAKVTSPIMGVSSLSVRHVLNQLDNYNYPRGSELGQYTDRIAYSLFFAPIERICMAKYGFFHHLVDFILVILTGGVWLIWILIRYLRTNSR